HETAPRRYADALAAGLQVTPHTRVGGVTIAARAPTLTGGGRKVAQRNRGMITHPVFAVSGTPRRTWNWKEQTAGMKPGFFDDPASRAAPQVRDALLGAMRRVTEELARRI